MVSEPGESRRLAAANPFRDAVVTVVSDDAVAAEPLVQEIVRLGARCEVVSREQADRIRGSRASDVLVVEAGRFSGAAGADADRLIKTLEAQYGRAPIVVSGDEVRAPAELPVSSAQELGSERDQFRRVVASALQAASAARGVANPWIGERVVVVTDDPPSVEAAVTQLEAWGAQPAVMFERTRALRALSSREPDLVVLDFGSDPAVGRTLLGDLEEVQPILPGALHAAPVVALAEGPVAPRLEREAWAPIHVVPHDDPEMVRAALLAALEDAIAPAAVAAPPVGETRAPATMHSGPYVLPPPEFPAGWALVGGTVVLLGILVLSLVAPPRSTPETSSPFTDVFREVQARLDSAILSAIDPAPQATRNDDRLLDGITGVMLVAAVAAMSAVVAEMLFALRKRRRLRAAQEAIPASVTSEFDAWLGQFWERRASG